MQQPEALFVGEEMPHAASRRQWLTVPFDLPHLDFVHTAQLSRMFTPDSRDHPPSFIAVDQPLPMQLSISHTRHWAVDSSPARVPEVMEFEYELRACPETWLIGGPRKARFRAKVGVPLSLALPLDLLSGHRDPADRHRRVTVTDVRSSSFRKRRERFSTRPWRSGRALRRPAGVARQASDRTASPARRTISAKVRR